MTTTNETTARQTGNDHECSGQFCETCIRAAYEAERAAEEALRAEEDAYYEAQLAEVAQ